MWHLSLQQLGVAADSVGRRGQQIIAQRQLLFRRLHLLVRLLRFLERLHGLVMLQFERPVHGSVAVIIHLGATHSPSLTLPRPVVHGAHLERVCRLCVLNIGLHYNLKL